MVEVDWKPESLSGYHPRLSSGSRAFHWVFLPARLQERSHEKRTHLPSGYPRATFPRATLELEAFGGVVMEDRMEDRMTGSK